MVGNIVKLGKDFHVVCDGSTHWHRQALGRGTKLEARKIDNCTCNKVQRPQSQVNGSIASL